MVGSSFAALVLSGFLTAGSANSTQWKADYQSAYSQAIAEGKPLAVFLVKGNAIVSLTTDTNKVLAKEYIAVMVNTDSPEGQSLAKSFEMQQGVVVSDRTAVKQALRVEGTIPATSDFANTLTRLADPARTVTNTEVQGVVQASAETVLSAPAPIMNGAPVYGPAPVMNAPLYQPYGGVVVTNPTCKSCQQRR